VFTEYRRTQEYLVEFMNKQTVEDKVYTESQ